MGMINYARLKAQGRVKDIGVPWNEAELKAIYKLKIPADYVRDGILTLEDYEDAVREEKETSKPLTREAISVLFDICKHLKILVTPDAEHDSLVRVITSELRKTKQSLRSVYLEMKRDVKPSVMKTEKLKKEDLTPAPEDEDDNIEEDEDLSLDEGTLDDEPSEDEIPSGDEDDEEDLSGIETKKKKKKTK